MAASRTGAEPFGLAGWVDSFAPASRQRRRDAGDGAGVLSPSMAAVGAPARGAVGVRRARIAKRQGRERDRGSGDSDNDGIKSAAVVPRTLPTQQRRSGSRATAGYGLETTCATLRDGGTLLTADCGIARRRGSRSPPVGDGGRTDHHTSDERSLPPRCSDPKLWTPGTAGRRRRGLEVAWAGAEMGDPDGKRHRAALDLVFHRNHVDIARFGGNRALARGART